MVRRITTGFWCGAAAGCAFILVGLGARALWGAMSLPELVQDRLLLLMPGSVFSFLLDRLLYLGKPLFFSSLLLAQVVLGGVAGAVIARVGRPLLVSAALWLLTGAVLLPLAGLGVFAGSATVALVTAACFAVYGVTVALLLGFPRTTRAWLVGPAPDSASSRVDAGDTGRRRLLAGIGLSVAAVLAARFTFTRAPLQSNQGSLTGADGGVWLPPAELDAIEQEAASLGLPPIVTLTADFYVVSKNIIDPELDAGAWTLQIDGLVERPLTLRFSDLLALPSVTEYRTLECISNEVGGDLMSNGLWTGARLADVLRQAGVRPGATAVFFTSADRYTSSMPLAQAMDPSTLLAYRLNSEMLPAKHGLPMRVLGAGTYGMKNPKWVTRIEVVNSTRQGFWQQQGWDEDEIVQTMSRLVVPTDGGRAPLAGLAVAGMAFAGARGVTRVELSSDGGATWSDARLLPSLGPNTWTFWRWQWQPSSAGTHTLTVRATDGTGAVQTARRTDPFPVGATGYHQVRTVAGD